MYVIEFPAVGKNCSLYFGWASTKISENPDKFQFSHGPTTLPYALLFQTKEIAEAKLSSLDEASFPCNGHVVLAEQARDRLEAESTVEASSRH